MAKNQNRSSHQKSLPDTFGKRNPSLDNLNRLSSLSLDKSVNSSETGDLKVLLSNYLRWHHVENHSLLTIRDYQDELGAFIHSLENKGHSLRAQDITPFDIMVYLEELKNRGQAASTIKRTYGNLLAWFNWMVRWDFFLTNPVRKVSRPKEPKVKKGFLAPEHIQSLLDLCPQGLFQGARRRAMLALPLN